MNVGTLLVVLSLIDHIALAVDMAPRVKKEYDALSFCIRRLVANDREPTHVEWLDIGRRMEVASKRLRDAHALLEGE